MGGIHVCERTTSDHDYIYVAAQSQLYLPTVLHSRPNHTDGTNGAFPEFIHGFYVGDYGLDIGLVYRSSWSLDFFSYAAVYPDQAKQSSSFEIPAWNVMLKTYFENGHLIAQCTSEDGSRIYADLSVEITDDSYRRYQSGSQINREMLLAMNPDQPKGKHYHLPANAYYSQAKFTNTTLTTASGSYVFMTSENSYPRYDRPDSGMPDMSAYYDSDTRSVTEFGKYVADVTTATLDKEKYSITPIS